MCLSISCTQCCSAAECHRVIDCPSPAENKGPREWGCILALLQGGVSIWEGVSSMWFLSGNTMSVGEPAEKYLELEQIGQG